MKQGQVVGEELFQAFEMRISSLLSHSRPDVLDV